MLDSEYTTQNCSIARALEAVGERWTLLIVRELMLRPRRFTGLQRSLSVAKNVLATRLDKLVSLGIVEKVPYTAARDWNEYQLTPKGLDLFPVISALIAWGDTYDAPHGPPLVLEHACGQPAGHRLVCRHCGGDVTAENTRATAGPGLLTNRG